MVSPTLALTREKESVLRAHVSIAIATGVWLFNDDLPGPREQPQQLFSAVSLSGAVRHGSAHVATSRPDLVERAQAWLGGEGIDGDVVEVLMHARDIDGTTVEVELDLPVSSWPAAGAAADALVEWADYQVVPGVAADRVEWSGSSPDDAEAKALWSHTVLICDQVHEGAREPHCDHVAAAELLPTEFNTVEQTDGRVFLGLHASLLCLEDKETVRALVNLIDELHGWWSSTWLLDQHLLNVSLETTAQLRNDPLSQLTHVPDMLAAVTSDVGTIRVRLDSFRLGLGGIEWPVWDSACDRWALEENLMAIERKRQLLMDMHSAFREAMQARRAARLNQLAGFFAAMSSVASFVAVFVFLYPDLDRDGGHLALRAALAAAALLLTLLALLWSSRLVLRSSQALARERP